MTVLKDATTSEPRPAIQIRAVRTAEDFESVYAIRDEVFHHEQQLTPYVRDDPDDAFSLNLLAFIDERPVGTGRVTLFGDEAQVAWVAVLAPYRRHGAGRAIMEHLIRWSQAQGARYVTLNAQTHALDFYRRLGFEPVGRRFYMGHIEHQVMILDLISQPERR
uniref:GNAT family N-acetyltransferase n=1 Tax=Thermorudis peleae TaxID=1382356 RepID=A0A831TGE8_9BACT